MGRNVLILFLAFNSLVLFGCAEAIVAGAAGAGSVAYVRGDLEAVKEVSIHRGWQATKEAVDDLEFRVKDQNKDATVAVLKAKTADDHNVKITLERVDENLTKFYIRVGLFGDKEKSRLILDTIEKHL